MSPSDHSEQAAGAGSTGGSAESAEDLALAELAGPGVVTPTAVEDGPAPDARAAGPAGSGSRRSRLRGHAIDTRPLRIASFRRQVLGQGTSFIGSMLTQVAVPVQVYDLSHSSLQVGLVGLVGFLPLVAFGLWGGAVADAMDRRTLYLMSSIASWVMTIGLLAQTVAGVDNVPLILALVAAQSGFFAVASSTRGAIVPRIVPLDLVPAANTITFTVGNVGSVIGPLLAGVLVTRSHGFEFAYGVDAILFTLALYAALRLPHIPPEGTTQSPGLRSVLGGLAFIATRPVLLMSFAVDIVAMVFAMPRALFPQVAADRFHGQVGPLYAAIAIGSVIAGVSGGWIGKVRRQGIALMCAIVGWGIAIAVSGLAHSLWLAVVLLALAGAADLVSAVFRQTILQTYAPDEMRGRLQGVFVVVVAGGPRLGDLRAGGTAAITGATVSWVGGGIACAVLVVIATFLVTPFRRYDAKAALPVEAPLPAVSAQD